MSSCVNKPAGPKTATVYLASSMSILKDDIAALAQNDFKLESGLSSSSVIAKQIAFGAPCELAIVADERWRDYLLNYKVAKAHPLPLAQNALVIAAVAAQASRNLGELLSPKTASKLIIADPEYVPLGSYAKEALISSGYFDAWKDRLILAHSARNAVVLLKQGAAPLAIIFKTDAKEFHTLHDFDRSLHRPISYPVLICMRGNEDKAKTLLNLPLFATV